MTGYFSYDADWLEQHHALHTAREIWQQPDLWAALHQQLVAQQEQCSAFLTPLLQNPRLQIVLCGAGSSAFAGRALAPWLRENRPRCCGLWHHRYRRQSAAVSRIHHARRCWSLRPFRQQPGKRRLGGAGRSTAPPVLSPDAGMQPGQPVGQLRARP